MVYYVGVRTYIAVKSREDADRVAREAAGRAAGRVWIEARDSASGREHSSQFPPDGVSAETPMGSQPRSRALIRGFSRRRRSNGDAKRR
jgi:hypothetical protein